MQSADPQTAQLAPPEPNLEMLQTALEALQEQIRFADTKAGFLATLNLLLFGVIAQESDKIISLQPVAHNGLYHFTLCVLVIYAIASFGAVACVIMAVIPRIHSTVAPPSRSHFAHVTGSYGDDHARYTNDVLNMTTIDWAKDLAWQTLSVSNIAHIKHRLVRRASVCTAVSMVLWIVALISIIGGKVM